MTRPAPDGSRTVSAVFAVGTAKHGASSDEAKARYAKRGPTGFLHPIETWSVLIGRRVVDMGVNARNAHRAFKRWCKFAAGSEGVASGQQVTLTKDGKIIQTYKPCQPTP